MLFAVELADLAANAGRLAVLAVPALLGALVVRVGWIPEPEAATRALNVYTLHIGFPALIAIGVLDVRAATTSGWWFWLLYPLVDLILVTFAVVVGRLRAGRQAGTMALVLLFGNTAYLGLPFAVSVLGPSARGPSSLLVAVQVTIAVLVGPVLLQRWSGTARGRVEWRRVLGQPLLWSPLVGVVLRLLPNAARDAAGEVLAPLAASTAPVAMFLLGLYVMHHRDRVRSIDGGVVGHVVLRVIVAPLVGLGVAVLLFRAGTIDATTMAAAVLLGGMPAAISCFSIAHHEDVAPDRVASVVVWSSLAAVVTMPVLATLAEALGRWRA